MNTNPSITRFGNHFIRLDKEWWLIDGPWYDFLSWLSNGSSMPVRVSQIEPMSASIYTNDTLPIYAEWPVVEWLPKVWYPDWTHKYDLTVMDVPWNRWQSSRLMIGYVMQPDGKLPAFIDVQVPGNASEDWWLSVWDWANKTI